MAEKVYKGDCLEVLHSFPDGCVDLVYLDPPFFTQKEHKLRARDRKRQFSFGDVWTSHQHYADFLYARLLEIHRVLSSTGSIFFHCDRNASHIVRSILEDVFGADNFRSEIIWYYKRWSNSRKGLLPAHQTIYFFTKSSGFTFNTLYEEYSASTNVDQILQRRKRDQWGKSVYDVDENGEVTTSGGKKGVPLSDVWDIPYLNPKAKERTGYPTQKPIILLERIISISSNTGDTVLDPFCGSGTTLIAAKLLDRKAIGIDVSEDALEITRSRLQNPSKTSSRLLEEGRESYKSADEKALALLKGLPCVPVHRNKGIDAILNDDLHGSPVLLRVQRTHESIPEAATKLYNAAKRKNALVMFLVAVHRQGFLNLGYQLPPGVIVINAPAIAITQIISQLKSSNKSTIGHLIEELQET